VCLRMVLPLPAARSRAARIVSRITAHAPG
jgi:hypothetical protein